MADSLKRKTGLALLWSFIDKGGQQVIQLVFVYILTRLVSKEEFGLVALLGVFSIIANILQESGFSSALIRKKEVTNEEYSSVFYFNISMSVILYVLFFFSAPLISLYFNSPILTNLSRFIFLAFIFNSFSIIQNVNLVKEMNFKANTRITLIAGVCAGIIAIIMAYNGLGVWSLAAQLVIQSFIRSTLLWIVVKWRPQRQGASFSYIQDMFGFSSKLLLTSLMNQLCSNIFPIIIGKRFSLSQVAAYSQGNKLNAISQSIISDGIKSVAYPLFSKIGLDSVQEKKAFRKIVRLTAFISFPVAILLIIMAKAIVGIYLPNDWGDTIPILQILAVGGAIYPLYNLLVMLQQYKGKSGQFFIMELIRNSLLLLSIFFSIHFGILGLVAGISASNIIACIIGWITTRHFVSYTLKETILDTAPFLFIAIIAYSPMLLLNYIGIENNYLLFFIPSIVGSLFYLALIKISGSVILKELIEFLKGFKK